MTIQTFTTLGGTATGVKVAKIGVSGFETNCSCRRALTAIFCHFFLAWIDAHDVRGSHYNPHSIKSDINGLNRWVPKPVPDEICFEAIKAGVDMLPPGVKMLINSSKHLFNHLS